MYVYCVCVCVVAPAQDHGRHGGIEKETEKREVREIQLTFTKSSIASCIMVLS